MSATRQDNVIKSVTSFGGGGFLVEASTNGDGNVAKMLSFMADLKPLNKGSTRQQEDDHQRWTAGMARFARGKVGCDISRFIFANRHELPNDLLANGQTNIPSIVSASMDATTGVACAWVHSRSRPTRSTSTDSTAKAMHTKFREVVSEWLARKLLGGVDESVITNKAREVTKAMDEFFTSTTLKEMYYVIAVNRLPLLLMLRSARLSDVVNHVKAIVKHFHLKANAVRSMVDHSSVWGGEEPASRVSKAWVDLSNLLHANSTIAVHAPRLVEWLEDVDRWADTWDVTDGDGLSVRYSVPETQVPRDVLERWGRIVPTTTTSEQAAVNTIAYELQVRVACIDAPEWYQPFLVAKPLLRYMNATLKWIVRISRVWYTDDQETGSTGPPRLFAEVMIAPGGMRAQSALSTLNPSQANAVAALYSGTPGLVRQEAPLRFLLVASGAVYRMPQYEFCESVDDLQLSIDLMEVAHTSASTFFDPTPQQQPVKVVIEYSEGRGANQDDERDREQMSITLREATEGEQALHFLCRVFQNMVDSHAFKAFDTFFPADNSRPAPRTKKEYQTALLEWHKVGLNVYMLESQGPQELDRGAIKSFFAECNEPSAPESWRENWEVYKWWRYDSDWDAFPLQMLWGQPHRAKEAWRRGATGRNH